MAVVTQRLDDYLSGYERNWPLSGTVLVAQHGEILFRKAYGYANIEHQVSNTMDTKFRIWSLTKSFTAMAIMMLYEQKLLHFEDDISHYLPEAAHLNHVSVAHLLTHTSGLANYTSLPEYNKKLNKLRLTQSDVLHLFIDQPLSFKPGTSFAYTNSGYFLLGMLIERIANSTFESYIQNHILTPLGMGNTGIDNNKKVINQMSSSYHSSWEDFIPCEYMDMSSSFSAGAMYSTVDDLYLWDQALSSAKLVSRETMDLAFKPNDFNYGFGWFLDKRYGRSRVYHGGAYRGFRSELHRYPNDNACIIMLTNYDFVPVLRLTESLTDMLFGGHAPVPERPQPWSIDEHVYANYMGTYEGYGCTAVVDRHDDQLFFVWNEEEFIPIYPISETTFHHTWYDWKCNFMIEDSGDISFLGMKKRQE
ncbi:serine hydrolase [Paenibacillaceae bacterium]|nr:serine hydrolase [Paenibacillaceae bacterium]